jgi:hypothetical protein
MGFLNLLTILFVGLKLTDHIDWSWWIVLAPTWIPWAFAGVILLVLFIGILSGMLVGWMANIR